MNNNDHLLQKMRLKECNHMGTTEETCELLFRVFNANQMNETKASALEKSKDIISACMKSEDWLENVSVLADACKDCISNLLQCLSSSMENEFLHKRFVFYTDLYVELSSTLIGMLMSNTCECLKPPADFPEELSSLPFSENISVQFSRSIDLLAQIQKYAKNRNTDALAYCMQILFIADLKNVRMCDEQEKKYQAT